MKIKQKPPFCNRCGNTGLMTVLRAGKLEKAPCVHCAMFKKRYP